MNQTSKIINYLKRKFKEWITPYVLRNFPFEQTTKIHRFKTVYVKKGKIKEVRTYNSEGKRMRRSAT